MSYVLVTWFFLTGAVFSNLTCGKAAFGVDQTQRNLFRYIETASRVSVGIAESFIGDIPMEGIFSHLGNVKSVAKFGYILESRVDDVGRSFIGTAEDLWGEGSLNAANRGMRLPATDGQLIGSSTMGYTAPDGQVFLDPTLKGAERVETMRHEAVHAFLSPRGNGAVATFSKNVAQWGYDNRAFLNATEEMAAQWYATGSLRNAWNHVFNGAYTVRGGIVVTPWRWAAEGAAAAGGVGYGVYKLSSDE